jgi:D-tyrosyl-tRNA(Tyr) deacylase
LPESTVRAVVQRVRSARVEVDGEVTGAIGRGLLVLLGVGQGDTDKQAAWLAEKIAGLRIFEDADGKMNLSVQDIGGSVLVVSQFTLYGDCRKGRRPSFTEAAPPDVADRLYQVFVSHLRALGVPVETGVFQAHMDVHLVNEGPVTIIVETADG